MRCEPARSLAKNQCFAAEDAIVSKHARFQCSNDASSFNCSHGRTGQKKQRKRLLYASCWYQVEFSLWPPNERFEVIGLMGAYKDGISAERLYKMTGVAWSVAYRILRNVLQYRGNVTVGTSLMGLSRWIMPLFVVASRVRNVAGEGKNIVIFAVEHRENRMGFMAARLDERTHYEQIREFARQISPNSEIRTNVYLVLRFLCASHRHEAKTTLPEKLGEWLSKVHIIINFKIFLTDPTLVYCIDIFRNILINLISVSIAECCTLRCRNDFHRPLLTMCRFEHTLFILRYR